MRRGAIAAARHAVGVTSVMQRPPLTRAVPVNLGSGIPLDMLLGDPEVTAVSAGPAWTGGGYWTSEGTGYWTGPTVNLSVPFEIVARYSRPSTGNQYLGELSQNSFYRNEMRITTSTTLFRIKSDGVEYSASVATTTGAYTGVFGQNASKTPTLEVNAIAGTASGSATLLAGDCISLVGALGYDASRFPSSAGLRVWDFTVYRRQLTPAERTNIYASGVQTNPLSIAADAFACWDFANTYDNGGTPTVPDLVLGDGTRDLIGTSVDIGSDITTGATF